MTDSLSATAGRPAVLGAARDNTEDMDARPELATGAMYEEKGDAVDAIEVTSAGEVVRTPNNKKKKSGALALAAGQAVKEEIFTIGAGLKKDVGKIQQKMRRSPVVDPYTRLSLFFDLFSVLLYLVDYGSDLGVAILLKQENGDTFWWFTLTVLLIVVPLFLVNLFSIVWFHQDNQFRRKGSFPRRHHVSRTERIVLLVSHALFLGPIARQFYIIYYGLKEKSELPSEHSTQNVQGLYCLNETALRRDTRRKDYYSLRKYYQRDSAYLGLIDAFIQDAPQLMLQIYILAVRPPAQLDRALTAIYQVCSVVTSLVTLAWSMVSYEQANRWANPEKPKISLGGFLIQWLWRVCMVASRVISLVLFATVFNVEIFIFAGFHWLLMSMWIFMMGTNFCGSIDNKRRPLAEFVYNLVVGWIFLFDILHLTEGPMRLKQAVYYLLTLAEMSALLALWYACTLDGVAAVTNQNGGESHETIWSRQEWPRTLVVVAVPLTFAAGLASMAAYYRWFHPEGRMPEMRQRAALF